MRPKGVDNERINTLIYIYGKTPLYSDLLSKCNSKEEVATNQDIVYQNHVKKGVRPILRLHKGNTGYSFKIADLEGVRIRYEKRVLFDCKAKIEFHSYREEPFYIHVAYSDLSEAKKKRLVKHFTAKYLENEFLFNYERHNLADSKGHLISFSNIFNYSINDFSIDYIIDKSKFPQI